MNVRDILTLLKGYLKKDSLLLFFVSLILSVSFGGFIKAQSPTPAVEPPAPQAAPAQGSGVLASEELEIMPGVVVEILQLKRASGDTITLKFGMTNNTDQALSLTESSLFGTGFGYNWDVSKVALVDVVNKKKYLVIKDSENNCLCSKGSYGMHQLEPGARRTFSAKFPAPSAGVTEINIEIPGAPPFEDIPIAQ